MNVLFSVIIPTYNRASLIDETLQSVIEQRFVDFEILVIDDGSTDDTVAVVERMTDRFGGRLRLIRQSNSGPGAARNRGIAEARGEYVAFLDSDDLWFPWTLQTYKKVIDENNRPALVMGSAVYWSKPQDLEDAQDSAPVVEGFRDYLASAGERFVRTACVLAVRKNELRRVGGFTTRRINGEDYDLLYRLGTAHGFMRVVSPPVVAYRQHGHSSARNFSLSFRGIVHQLGQDRRGRYPGNPHRQRERQQLLMFSTRNASWFFLEHGKRRWAWALYWRAFFAHVRTRYFRYLLGFPVLAVSAAVRRRVS